MRIILKREEVTYDFSYADVAIISDKDSIEFLHKFNVNIAKQFRNKNSKKIHEQIIAAEIMQKSVIELEI